MHFSQYIALGDSMSIDLYPALDAGEVEVAVALERRVEAGVIAPLGAASLLFRNNDARYPDSQSLDLVSRYPGITMQNRASDGATIGDIFGEQLMSLEATDGSSLVTLTAGGNDLLSAFANRPRASLLDAIRQEVMDAYDFLVDAIRRAVPDATVILTSIYDPSDDTGHIPGVFENAGALPIHVLREMNDHIRSVAEGTPNCLFADAYSLFLGHGASAPVEERWYWKRALVEPNAMGADELRRLWWDLLDVADSQS